MGTGRPSTQGPPAPLAASAESGPCPQPRNAPSSSQARAARRSRSPVLRCRFRPAVTTSDFTRVGGPFSAGHTPARKSPAFLEQIRPPAPESPTPSGSAHQRPERAPRLPSVSSGSPAL
ncbi:hypothetical protein NDU88_002160 [Pleurodeles waltl]|uniref:Uncharacterized protein n=1 Tax=Pleurodeles waltl TaxID=8319 RepID=A0AAV7W393_PLEWA|nr:hypothetical protein NDU88_002160 [Pleurodeles waltl]